MKSINPILTFIIGIIFLFVPGSILKLAISLIGIAVIITSGIGIYDNLKNSNKIEMSYNIIILLFGLIIFSNPTVIAGIIPFIVGIWLILKSTFQLLILKSTLVKDKIYISKLIINIVLLIIGIVLLFNPFESAVLVLRIIGIILIIYSIIEYIDKNKLEIKLKPKKVKVIK